MDKRTVVHLHHTYLTVKWTTSRGRDTYGYNICTVIDQNTGARYRCMGGGYDMLGTSIGHWLEDTFQQRLHRFFKAQLGPADDLFTPRNETIRQPGGFYGVTYTPDRIHLDGACGLSCMQSVGEAVGLKWEWIGNRRRETAGYRVEWESTPGEPD